MSQDKACVHLYMLKVGNTKCFPLVYYIMAFSKLIENVHLLRGVDVGSQATPKPAIKKLQGFEKEICSCCQ